MSQCTLQLNGRFLKPGTKVLIGPEGGKFSGVIYKSHLTVYCDQSHFVEHDVEWWDDKTVYRQTFAADDLELAETTEE